MGRVLYDDTLRGLEALPALPEVINKILEEARDPDSSASDLAELIEKDEALAARLLRLVNSPFYGLSRKISTVQTAVALLGFGTVRSLLLSVCVFQSLRWANPRKDLRFLRFWQHALGAATAGRLIAAHLKWKDPDEIFTAGLMHDLGKLLMLRKHAEPFDEACRQARLRNADLVEAEESAFGITHPQLGELVAQKWRFPDRLCAAIRHHHSPALARRHGGEGRHNAALAVVAANALAKLSLMGEGGNDHRPGPDPEVLAALGLSREALAELCVRTAQQSVQAYRTFGLRTELRARMMIPLNPKEPFARVCLRVAILDGDAVAWEPALLTLRAFGHVVERWDRLADDAPSDLRPHVIVASSPAHLDALRTRREAQPEGLPGIVLRVPLKTSAADLKRLEASGVVTLPPTHAPVDLFDALLKSYLDASSAGP
jgi:HD-like signal output (HDOD) protein